METQGKPKPARTVQLLLDILAWWERERADFVGRILESLGIESKIDLPGVGENMIEQITAFILLGADIEPAAHAYQIFPTAADLFGEKLGEVESSTRARLSEWAQAIVDASEGALNLAAQKEILALQHDLLFKRNTTVGEIITAITGEIVASQFWYVWPFSRGRVHLKSPDAINEPVIDVGAFAADFDLEAQTAVGRLAMDFWETEPMASHITGRLIPDTETLPANATDAQWESYLRGNSE